jgi:uncharacterized protein
MSAQLELHLGFKPAALRLDELCRRWKITELAVFGPVLQDGFQVGSDIDVLVTFLPDASLNLWDLVQVQKELTQRFGRQVNLIERKSLTDTYRRKEILKYLEVLYAA